MTNLFDLSGRYALVVGASSGLGVQFAQALAKQGASVAIAARRMERLQNVQKTITALGVKCISVKCDVTNENSVIECVEKVKQALGRIDILCNNAGINIRGDLLTFKTADWDRVINTNLRGQFLMSREVGKLMKKQGYGKIINTASDGGLRGSAQHIAYHASKGAISNFTRALAADLAPYHVTVNAIGPGIFDTELTHDHLPSAKKAAKIPLGRIGQPGELDGALLYFASDASSYCTGQTLYVDGGATSVL